MPDARCTRGPVCKKEEEDAHEHTGSAEAIRHSLRNGFTAYVALSPAIGLFYTVVSRIWLTEPGWDDRPPGDLTPTIEASGPHDFAVRSSHRSSARRLIAHRLSSNPPCHRVSRPTLPRPPHPAPRL